jgi:hypothetical protein
MAEFNKPPQLLALLKKSQAFAENMLQENEQLRLRLAATQERMQAAESERNGLRDRIDAVQYESNANLERFQEIDEELNTLANLHVATWQMHSSMRLSEVVNVMVEIGVNLIGANEIVVYLLDEERRRLLPVLERATEGATEIGLGEGLIGGAVEAGRVLVEWGAVPPVILPLRYGTRPLGAVVIKSWLPQKTSVTNLDAQLFTLLCEQGATALFAAYLAGATEARMTSASIAEQLAR